LTNAVINVPMTVPMISACPNVMISAPCAGIPLDRLETSPTYRIECRSIAHSFGRIIALGFVYALPRWISDISANGIPESFVQAEYTAFDRSKMTHAAIAIDSICTAFGNDSTVFECPSTEFSTPAFVGGATLRP